ncbi:amylosucrase [Dictyobacter alpinus]|uniref:Amylosucrase n=1 Tax=Dictyobacter alpinus TaxID=2014873 RepID=A0A402BF87_9CHLR|nr:alpha-amylase family glycosyl hydrolase [Dictyobacter alpinus]GCE30055.1 amylosucrase [Dictyobacter alpinus]
MADVQQVRQYAALSLDRLWPRLELTFRDDVSRAPVDWQAFETRLRHEWDQLFGLLFNLYGGHYDFFYHLEVLLHAVARSWFERSPWLKRLDTRREAEPLWFQSQQMVGGMCYTDLFAGNLQGLREKLPVFKQLGLTYLHLMPLFESPEGNSDGGYAVSSYRQLNPKLGTIQELADLAHEFQEQGISLVLDFVFNHTSDEHEWARLAQAGDLEYENFYFLFPDRTIPDIYERTLREIFPTVRRGSFTWREDIHKWVWTTFNSFQWDLNYGNPAVFRAMAQEMLAIANLGVEILRLDAVAFIWKREGTNCENQPEAHQIIQAFHCLARIAAPALRFKSEAIVHPDDVMSYISPQECQISYNPLLMALLWESLATGEVKLLDHSLSHRFRLPHGTSWVNYVRSHDDIGWTFDDNDARWEWIDPFGHRNFLNQFYMGRFPGSFARGVPFQENPDTGDARISGTLASLAGLEQAIHAGNEQQIDLAVRRILMVHSIILSIGGIPLIYLGDEVGTLNDYAFSADPDKADDSRWVHRPRTDWSWREKVAHDPLSPHGRIFAELVHLIALRKRQTAIFDGETEFVETGNAHLFGYVRNGGGQRLFTIASFSAQPQEMDANLLRSYGSGYLFTDLITGQTVSAEQSLRLEPYQCVWLELVSTS